MFHTSSAELEQGVVLVADHHLEFGIVGTCYQFPERQANMPVWHEISLLSLGQTSNANANENGKQRPILFFLSV